MNIKDVSEINHNLLFFPKGLASYVTQQAELCFLPGLSGSNF